MSKKIAGKTTKANVPPCGLCGKKNPTLATIQKLADALGVSADELLK